jgi:hypothetical protein
MGEMVLLPAPALSAEPQQSNRLDAPNTSRVLSQLGKDDLGQIPYVREHGLSTRPSAIAASAR